MVDSLSRHWWAVALRGVAAVLFGLMAFWWPGITLFALVVVFGAYVLADGILTLVSAMRGREAAGTGPGGRGWLIAEGLAGIAIGVLALITLIGVAALAIGITLLVFSFRMRHRRVDVPTRRHYGRPAAA